jgi:hypothetical protein
MNKITKITLLFALVALFCATSFAQTNFTTTTLSAALSAKGQGNSGSLGASGVIVVGSTTGMYAPGLNPAYGSIGSVSAPNITYLIVNREVMRVNSVPSSTQVGVERGVQGTKAVAHQSGETVYVAYAQQLVNSDPTGSCVNSAAITYLPVYAYNSGNFYNCTSTGPNAGNWVISNSQNVEGYADGSFFVAPSACWFTNTTYTGTPAFIVLGASNVPVLNQTTNSTAGTETLTCGINVPTRLTANKGIYIKSINTYYGVQTTALTSIGTPTLSTITMPAPAATETASTVTPVAVTGTFTNNTVTSGLGLTTAGAFWSVKSTLATPLAVTSDLTWIVFTIPFVDTTSGVLTLNTPGLQIYYNLISN